MKKHVLITGSAGFLGSHLVEYHLAQGHRVYGIDNYSSSRHDSIHHKRLRSYANEYLFMAEDICNPSIVSWFKDIPLDIIYNFACPASPPRYQDIPIETTMACVVGTSNVLKVAKPQTVVLHASTSEVYGDPNISPQPESYRGYVNSYGPRACYDEGKRAAEALCYDYRKKHGVDVRIVRIFNTYGPHMDPQDGRVITNFIYQALKGQKLTIYGTGLQTRSFCYVSDLIDGITKLAALDSNPETPINLGNPDEFTMIKLAEKIQTIFGTGIEYLELPVDDPTQRCPDITLARNILGWNPKVTLDEGLDRTIHYFRSLNVNV